MPQKHESPELSLPGLSEPDHAGKPIGPESNKSKPDLQAAPAEKPGRDEGRNRKYSDDYRKRVRASKPTKALLALAFRGFAP